MIYELLTHYKQAHKRIVTIGFVDHLRVFGLCATLLFDIPSNHIVY